MAEDALGRRMSVLGISEAKSIDSGRWSCAAEDAGRKRCKAMWLSVLRPPDIKLMPSTLTVNKVSLRANILNKAKHSIIPIN